MRSTKLTIPVAVGVLMVIALFVVGCSDDDEPSAPVLQWKWAPVGEGLNLSFALAIYDNHLITGLWEVFEWDGSSLAPLSGHLNGVVRAYGLFEGKLIAAGDFTSIAGVSASYIAAWDGANWTPLGAGMNERVEALTVWNNRLIAAGNFTNAGGVSATRLAAWDGGSWAPLGAGSTSTVSALTVFDGKLIADIGPGPAAWDGSSWTLIPDGAEITISGSLSALATYDGRLIVAGAVRDSGALVYVAAWDGSSWHRLETGTNSWIYDFTIVDNELIAAGAFTTAGGLDANYIATWDGVSWQPLGSGMDAVVYALTPWNNKLIATGNFLTAGGVSVPGVAAWGLQ